MTAIASCLTNGDWIPFLIGGLIIGASAVSVLLLLGKIAGISGILTKAISVGPDRDPQDVWATWFMAGILLGGALLVLVAADVFPVLFDRPIWIYPFAGFLVGYGTRMSGGCTSGHGVCGLGRASGRSLVATLTFMIVAMLTVKLISLVNEVLR